MNKDDLIKISDKDYGVGILVQELSPTFMVSVIKFLQIIVGVVIEKLIEDKQIQRGDRIDFRIRVKKTQEN